MTDELEDRCEECDRPAQTTYDHSRLCQRCAVACKQRDIEEADDISGLMGG